MDLMAIVDNDGDHDEWIAFKPVLHPADRRYEIYPALHRQIRVEQKNVDLPRRQKALQRLRGMGIAGLDLMIARHSVANGLGYLRKSVGDRDVEGGHDLLSDR